jgi:hypothetical protein
LIHSSTKRPKMSRLFSRLLASAYLWRCCTGGRGRERRPRLRDHLRGWAGKGWLEARAQTARARCGQPARAPTTKFCSLPTASTSRMAASVGAGGGWRPSTLRRCLMMPCGGGMSAAGGFLQPRRHGWQRLTAAHFDSHAPCTRTRVR